MQQIPKTYPPFSPYKHPLYIKSIVQDTVPVMYNRKDINVMKKQSNSTENHSFKKRLEIFKQYQPRFNTISQNDDTVVYQKRKRGIDSQGNQNVKQPAYQRQIQNGRKLNRYNSGNDLVGQSGKRRQKIFSVFKPNRSPDYHLSFKSMKESQKQQLISTQGLRKNIETLLPSTLENDAKCFSLLSAKTENHSLNFQTNIYSRNPSIQNFGLEGQAMNNLISSAQNKQQTQLNASISPKKITFTYQNSSSFAGFRQIPAFTVSNLSLYGSQTLQTKVVNKVESPVLPRSVVEHHNTAYKQSTVINNIRSSNEKKTFDFRDRTYTNGFKSTQTNKLSSWGNKIRTELMGHKQQLQDKQSKQKEFDSSKISLNLIKQSLIINGEKINRQNLKINESLSNISDDQTSKRYFDQQIDFMPQVKKISYNNIDISRQDSLPEPHEQFRTHQLLLEFQTQKFETNKNEEILQILDVSPVYKSTNKKKEEPILGKNILHELSEEIKSEQLVKKVNKTGKSFPIVLVIFATMLFIIQAVV